ncbi:MAG: hypothetical protein V1874_11025 [Spirochaetota bacterium]
MKIDEIRRIGFNALRKSLGPDGMLRFIHQFDSGSGDYTKERHQWLDKYDVESIYKEINKK